MGHTSAELTASLAWAESLPEARLAFRRFAAQAGVDRYAYAWFSPEGAPRHIDTTYPEPWVAHYMAMDYSRIDPVIGEARRSHLPFSWRTLTGRSSLAPDQRRLFEEAAHHGISHGYTIPLQCRAGFALLSVAFDREDCLRAALAAKPDIKMLAGYYHNTVERLLSRRENGSAENLSDDECHSLSGIAAGRTLWQIASDLQLPENAVGRLLRTARLKLGMATTAEAVAAARDRGYIR